MTLTVLLVDDSKSSRTVNFAYLFSVLGADMKCLEAMRGDQAIALLETEQIDLVLLDLTMPGMSGFDVLAEMRTRDMKVPVVVISADVQRQTRERVVALGAVGFLEKPLRPEALANMLALLEVGHVG